MAIPYYRKAQMRFECQKCGACCSTWQGRVYIRLEDVPGMAAACGFSPGQFLVKYTKRDLLGHRHLVLKSNGYCIFYEDGSCAVNSVKPGSCFAWPFWRKVCTTRRGWHRAARKCPGIGKGRFWSEEEIEKKLALTP